ncbi:MAG: biotin--[acetyl-CoA-carboxylase] ligase [Candidatus Margulisiibacteriota bacterium]
MTISLQTEHFATLDSTNLEAKRRLPTLPNNTWLQLSADVQTQGRGQFERIWYSADDGGLYYTLAAPNPSQDPLPSDFTVQIAHTIVAALQKLGLPSPEIEWPNDLILDGRKVGGILVETVVNASAKGPKYSIIGIGLNLNQAEFPKPLDVSAISFYQVTGNLTPKSEVITALTKELTHDLSGHSRRDYGR